MFFSNKEKKIGGSRVLTEAEIKKKLYGDFETTSADSKSSTQEVKMSGVAFESQVNSKRAPSSGAAIRSPSFGATSRPEILSSRPVTPPFADAAPRYSSSASQRGSFKSAQKADIAFDWKTFLANGAKFVLGILTSILWKAGSYLAQSLDFILKILDPRKPQARKLLYSITACLLVAALFFGVFRLNAQRKKAMSGEIRKDPISAVVPAKTAVSQAVSSGVISSPSAEKQSSQSLNQNSDDIPVKAAEVLPPSAAGMLSEAAQVPQGGAGKYVIQVATYATLGDANQVIRAIEQAGFTAFTKKQMRNSTGHTFYPVYLGRYEKFVTAQQSLSKFRKASVARPFQDSFVRTLE